MKLYHLLYLITIPAGIALFLHMISQDTIAGPEVGAHPMTVVIASLGAGMVGLVPLFIDFLNSDPSY